VGDGQRKNSKPRRSEKSVMSEVMQALSGRGDLRAWRNNVGAARDGGRFVRFGLPGSADITGILNDGRRLEIEVKAPGGRLSEKQKNFGAMIQKFGGVFFVVRSAAELLELLEQTKKRARP